MAKIPIEIFNFSKKFENVIVESIKSVNSLQNSIDYTTINNIDRSEFQILNDDYVNTKFLFDEMEQVRKKDWWIPPHLLMISDKPLYNEYYNLFGSSRATDGLGVFTTNNVYDTIIPIDKIKAYIIYFLCSYTIKFLNPNHKNHKETKNCIYDRKTSKLDIKKSMKSDAFCDDCKKNLLAGDSKITNEILNDMNNLLGESGRILNDIALPEENKKRNKIFISYCHKDEIWKDRLQVHLKPLQELGEIIVWSDDQIKPGDKWFEKIKNSMAASKIGILLISPDFLASDFINHVEIPHLLENVENEGGSIIPIIIRHSLFPRIKKLSQFQATNSPSNPIAGLSESDQDGIFVKIAESIWDSLDGK